MTGYREISSTEDLDRMLDRVAGFHDSLAKEFHVVNRGSVLPDLSMAMDHRFDGQFLIQSQGPPFALELVFSNITELHVNNPRECFSATGKVLCTGRNQEKAVELNFDGAIKIIARRLFHADRSDWLGHRAFLGREVPSVEAVHARKIEGRWRQCSAYSNAWAEEDGINFSLCPGCGKLTELVSP